MILRIAITLLVLLYPSTIFATKLSVRNLFIYGIAPGVKVNEVLLDSILGKKLKKIVKQRRIRIVFSDCQITGYPDGQDIWMETLTLTSPKYSTEKGLRINDSEDSIRTKYYKEADKGWSRQPYNSPEDSIRSNASYVVKWIMQSSFADSIIKKYEIFGEIQYYIHVDKRKIRSVEYYIAPD